MSLLSRTWIHGFLGGLFGVALATSMPAYAAQPNRCEDLLKLKVSQLDQLKKSFPDNDHFTIELPVTPIRNQCGYGDCWVYGTLAQFEQRILSTTGEHINLSENFIVYNDLRDKAQEAVRTHGQAITQGGSAPVAEKLIAKYGIVPEMAYTPRVEFYNAPHSDNIIYMLNARVIQYHVDLLKVTPQAQKDELAQEALKDMYDLIDVYFGAPAKTFEFRGAKYTPQEFAAKYLPQDKELVHVVPKESDGVDAAPLDFEDHNKPLHKRNNARTALVGVEKETQASLPEMQQMIVDSLKRGESVTLVTEIVGGFIDNKTGVMSVAAFPTPKGFEVPPRAYRAKYGVTGGLHLVDVVGADVDSSGKVIKFKIKNSWGELVGREGFYSMYADYFDAYVWQIDLHLPKK